MMNTMAHTAVRALATLSLSLVFGLAQAQQTDTYEADPPDRAGRLSFLQGDVSLQPAGEEDWAPAIANRPLTTGDKLWTDQGARAEIQVGEAAVRLDSNTGFSFLNLDDHTIQMRMTAGVIDVRVRALDSNDQIEIDTPNLALTLLRPGDYRVEVNDAGDNTIVKVSEGAAEASDGSQDVLVHADQAVTFTGTDRVTAQLGTLGEPDEFDSWSRERDRRYDRARSSRTAQYVSPEVTGYEDLDDHGNWISDAEYGYVWTPRYVAYDWSPYRYGRWVWVSPWGWTWIDDAPWGFAPFHYGRWAHIRHRWCWVPGPRYVRPVYAPALVGWFGSPGVSLSISVGSGVAWFPLGPREVYMPWRRYSPRYVERVNVTNTIVNRVIVRNLYDNRSTNVTYRNRSVPGAVTAVSQTAFTSAQRTGDHRVRLNERDLARTRVTAVAPQIQPGRDSRLGASETARRVMRVPPRAVADRQVIVKRDPPPQGARLARNLRDTQVRREQPDRFDRPQDRNDRTSVAAQRNAPNNSIVVTAPDRGRTQVTQEERIPRVPEARENRPIDARQNMERRLRTDRPQSEAVVREAPQSQPDRRAVAIRPQAERPREDRPQEREQPERQQLERHAIERRQIEVREREQTERRQQIEREYVPQPRPQPNLEQPRARPAPQHADPPEQRASERPPAERQHRSEPQSKPADDPPPSQPQEDNGRRRGHVRP
jgi:hypothetical protein